jgi:uncharacterized protein (TIGR02271 family)
MAAHEKAPHPPELTDETIPVLEEQATVTTHDVSKGGVRVSTRTNHVDEAIAVSLASEEVDIVRVSIGREVAVAPGVREDGDSVIIPIMEEVVVTQKKLVLKEELHINRRRTVRDVEVPVTRQIQKAVIERVRENGENDR